MYQNSWAATEKTSHLCSCTQERGGQFTLQPSMENGQAAATGQRRTEGQPEDRKANSICRHMPERRLPLGGLGKRQSLYGGQAEVTEWPAPRTEIKQKIQRYLQVSASAQLPSLQTHVFAAASKAEKLVSESRKRSARKVVRSCWACGRPWPCEQSKTANLGSG